MLQGTKDEDTGVWQALVRADGTMSILYMEGLEVIYLISLKLPQSTMHVQQQHCSK